jgi:hypothetical protein
VLVAALVRRGKEIVEEALGLGTAYMEGLPGLAAAVAEPRLQAFLLQRPTILTPTVLGEMAETARHGVTAIHMQAAERALRGWLAEATLYKEPPVLEVAARCIPMAQPIQAEVRAVTPQNLPQETAAQAL